MEDRRWLAGALPARRVAGGRAGLRREDHARRLRWSTPTACCATAAPRTPDYQDPRAGARGWSARRARRGCSKAASPIRPRRSRWAAASSGSALASMIAVALGLTASICLGDRRLHRRAQAPHARLLAVLAVSQTVALVLLGEVVAIRGDGPPRAHDLARRRAGGAWPACGRWRRSIAGWPMGAMAVVAPIAAIGRGAARGGWCGHGRAARRAAVAGIALALTGVVLAAREEARGRRRRAGAGAGLALLAALGFGSFLVGDGRRPATGDVLWALLVARGTERRAAGLLALVHRGPDRRVARPRRRG